MCYYDRINAWRCNRSTIPAYKFALLHLLPYTLFQMLDFRGLVEVLWFAMMAMDFERQEPTIEFRIEWKIEFLFFICLVGGDAIFFLVSYWWLWVKYAFPEMGPGCHINHMINVNVLVIVFTFVSPLSIFW